MKRILLIMVLLIVLAVPVHAAQMEFTAPAVPDPGRSLFPKETESFSDGMWQLLHNALTLVLKNRKHCALIQECIYQKRHRRCMAFTMMM